MIGAKIPDQEESADTDFTGNVTSTEGSELKMGGLAKIAVTLANSIIGVSILTMPFCLKQCGVILGTIMMMFGALVTRFTCHLLLKSGQISRRKTYELIAFSTFGPIGKLVVELCIIGFMIGILISFFVVMGDLGTPIVSKALDIQNSSRFRAFSLLAFGLGIALPLSMLKKVESLIGLSTISVVFYVLLAFKALCEALPVLFSKTCWDVMHLWRPSGILQSLPIFAMALSCQTQIFQVYDCLPDQSLKKMNSVIKIAVYMCTFLYLSVGVFGYSAFCNKEFGGNILTSFSPGIFTDIIKCCFLVSVLFSFPLVVLPCRSSIHSLIFKKHAGPIDAGLNNIPELRFKVITITLIVGTLFIGIVCPNIEMVLGFVGSTIGVVICIIMPAMMFINLTQKSTFEKWGAQFVLAVGFFLLVSGTWINLMEVSNAGVKDPEITVNTVANIDSRMLEVQNALKFDKDKILREILLTKSPQLTDKPVIPVDEQEMRKEPPNPQEPDEAKLKLDTSEVNAKPEVNPATSNPVNNMGDSGKKEEDIAQKQEEVLKKLEKQHAEQIEILEKQKEILEELKAHERNHEMKIGDEEDGVQDLKKTNAPVATDKDSVKKDIQTNKESKVAENLNPPLENGPRDFGETKLMDILNGSVIKSLPQEKPKPISVDTPTTVKVMAVERKDPQKLPERENTRSNVRVAVAGPESDVKKSNDEQNVPLREEREESDKIKPSAINDSLNEPKDEQ